MVNLGSWLMLCVPAEVDDVLERVTELDPGVGDLDHQSPNQDYIEANYLVQESVTFTKYKIYLFSGEKFI